tara:strand:- start:251 stop:760 length:510 start_codon:yes stop_codon:yes gene_type:complete
MSIADSFLNWGFKPLNTMDVLTEGGYKWGGDDKELDIKLVFEFGDQYNDGYISDDNYNRPQGKWYSINVYLLSDGWISFRKKDHEYPIDTILISNTMIDDWVENSDYIVQEMKDTAEMIWEDQQRVWEPMDKLSYFWDILSYSSEPVKQLVFDNMDKVLIESRGDFKGW